MSSDISIKIENLGKCYQIYDQPRDRLKQMIVSRLQHAIGQPQKKYFRDFWALRDASFEIRKGETVGIVGRNGSGKSTLLQMICGTLNPTEGYVQAHGRIAALLELGSGFNPEFSGRENVYMNAAVLGLSQEEIDYRFDDIAAFADIGKFIEQPVKTYSSGMFVRLAFSVNIMSQPEIMVVDEALAVGDMAFQAKCMTALRRIQDGGATVLFVSHDIGSIKSLCSKAAYLDGGRLKSFGQAARIAEDYVRIVREEMNSQSSPSAPDSVLIPPSVSSNSPARLCSVEYKTSDDFERRCAQHRYGDGGARVDFAEIVDLDGQPIVSAEFDQEVKIKIFFSTDIETDVSVNYYIQDDKKNPILGAGSRTVGSELLRCYPRSRYLATYLTRLPLTAGNYSVHLEITRPLIAGQSAQFLDVIDDAVVFNVQPREQGRIWAKIYIKNELEIVRL